MKLLVMLGLLTNAVWGGCPHPRADGSQFRALEGCLINRMYAPQCGSDGCNYVNGDAVRCANTFALTRNLPGVEMSHFGMCEEDKEEDNMIEDISADKGNGTDAPA
ncbi:unnamed protein product [Meganyctiphanes norvegica]|uniref:Uncharacterized protein n=1 Tax=Meganyctiphanes norvegica TaxID=48144 RepID=A0AAV2RR70_MEGNR